MVRAAWAWPKIKFTEGKEKKSEGTVHSTVLYWSFGQKYVVRVAICAEAYARTTGFSTNPKAP